MPSNALIDKAASQQAIVDYEKSRRWRLLRDLMKSRMAMMAVLIIFTVIFVAIAAPLLTQHDPTYTDLLLRLHPPVPFPGSSPDHFLGTDAVGRDIWARLAYGARISLTVGFVVVFISGLIGITLGLITGYFGGWIDDVVMRLADIQLAFPFILLMLAVLAVVGPGLRNLIVVMGVTGWVGYARVVRGEVLSLREKEFVEAAHAMGASNFRILFRTLLPNVFAPVMIIASFSVASVIIAEASLSFLGLGVRPDTPTWGIMLNEGREYMKSGWWLTTIPGLAIATTVFSINVLGDWLRDELDPRSVER